eukprot:363319-Chlamydomonas_euryale.AAC.2
MILVPNALRHGSRGQAASSCQALRVWGTGGRCGLDLAATGVAVRDRRRAPGVCVGGEGQKMRTAAVQQRKRLHTPSFQTPTKQCSPHCTYRHHTPHCPTLFHTHENAADSTSRDAMTTLGTLCAKPDDKRASTTCEAEVQQV